MLNRFWRRLTGPWCEKHPNQRIQRIFGCAECYLERCHEYTVTEAQRKRDKRVREIADGVKLALNEMHESGAYIRVKKAY